MLRKVSAVRIRPNAGSSTPCITLDISCLRRVHRLHHLEKALAAPTPSGPGAEKRDGTAAGGAKGKDTGDALNRSDTGASGSGASSGKDTTLGKLNYHLEQMK